MAEFSKLVVTEKGNALIAKALANTATIKFTKVSSTPTAYEPSELEKLESLSDIFQTHLKPKVQRINNTSVEVKAAFNNTELTNGYYIKAFGLYADDPDEGEILYGVAVETSGNCYMPAYNGVTSSGIYLRIVTTVGNSQNVSLEINPAAVATLGDIEELRDELEVVDFDDSGEIEGIESFTEFMSSFVKETSIYKLLANLKAGLKFVLHAGQIVNNCVTDNAGLPLAAAQGKALQDQITQLYSDITAPGDTVFVFDYQNGKYGYNLSPTRGADTFVPFSDEEAFRLALYNAIKPSGFVTANMTHAQMCAALAKIYGVPPLIIKVQITNTSGSNSVNTTTVTVYVNGTVSYSRSYIASQLINGKYVDIEGLIRLSAPHNNTITALRDIKRSSNMNFSSFVKMNTGTSFEWPYNSSEIWYYCAA